MARRIDNGANMKDNAEVQSVEELLQLNFTPLAAGRSGSEAAGPIGQLHSLRQNPLRPATFVRAFHQWPEKLYL